MFERFSDRARKVMALANQEALRFNHEYIGTEHILLGLVKEGSGVGATVLQHMKIDGRKVRLEVEKLVKSGPDMVTMGKLPQTSRAKKVIEYAIEEARNLGHSYVGTEHLLLGLLREKGGVAAQALMNLGLTFESALGKVRAAPKEEPESGPRVPPEEVHRLAANTPLVRTMRGAFEECHKRGTNVPQLVHIALALLAANDPLISQAFANLGLKPELLHAELVKLLQKPL